MMIGGCLWYIILAAFVVNARHKIIYEWKDLEYGFPTEADKQEAISNGNYIPQTGLPIDVDVHYGADNVRHTFITIPRLFDGIPFSLATVNTESGNPVLEAFPSYDLHKSQGEDCNGITSVHRVAIDECQRLWFVDSGKIKKTQKCPPQIMAYNLENNELLLRYQIPDGQFNPAKSELNTPLVDIKYKNGAPQCNQAMVYIADVKAPGLLVFDSASKTSWRIENELMNPDPDFKTFTIAGVSVDLLDGIYGMSLTPRAHIFGERYLYFHPLTGDSENRVPLKAINNASMWEGNPEGQPEVFEQLGRRGNQCVDEVIDARGNMYCGSTDPISIFAWNIKTPYEKRYFRNILKNQKDLQFCSGLKVIRNGKNQELWILSDRLQKVYTGTVNYDEVNFRVMVIERL